MASPNPIKDFKDRYAGQDTTGSNILSMNAQEILDVYENAYAKIIVQIQTAKKNVSYATYAKQTQLLKQIGSEIDKLKGQMATKLNEAIKEVALYGTTVAITDLQVLNATMNYAENWHKEFNADYAEQAFKDNYSHIAAQTQRMKHSVKMLMREESAKVFRRASVEGLTRKEAYSALQKEIMLKDPTFQFVDRRGRNWNSKTYFEMLSKTVMANSLNESYLNTLVNEGQDLVKVSSHGATDRCRSWEGKILSITGATTGYVTIEQARASGDIFHPRCKHRFFAYDQEIEDVFRQVEAGMTDKEILST